MNGVTVARPPRSRRRRVLLPVAVGLLVLVCDQIAKALVVRGLGPSRANHRWDLFDPLVAIHYVENTGAAFGTLRGQGAVLSGLAVLVVGALVLYYRSLIAPSLSVTLSLGLLLGGALGNLVDRLRLGYVVDYLAVGIWPKFNLADSAISIGVVVLAWQTLADADEQAAPRPVSATAMMTERPAGSSED